MGQLLVDAMFDESGLLVDTEAWSPGLARELALEDGIAELTPRHWDMIRLLRDYYSRYHVPPSASRICHELHTAHVSGRDLFPSCLSAWRIAGLPNPGEEARSYLSAE